MAKRLKEKDFTGKKFGRLTIIRFLGMATTTRLVEAKCDCGEIKSFRLYRLFTGSTISCGCFRKEVTSKNSRTHGMGRTAEYKIWCGIISRCTIKSASGYKYYGGRGIGVCKRWLRFENFYEDMGDRPTKKHSIDRIDYNGDYSKNNCRWASREEQSLNKSNNVTVNYCGEKFPLIYAVKMFGLVNYQSAKMRIWRHGWPALAAVIEPKRTNQYG